MERNAFDQYIGTLVQKGAQFVDCELSDQQVFLFTSYFFLLYEWNKKFNLTGLTSTEEIIACLFIDSIAPYRIFIEDQVDSILDIGSGAGFPGLALKIMLPHLQLVLLEPQLKKAAFLDYVVGKLDFQSVTVLPKRIEQLANDQPALSLTAATFKAISPFSILPSVAPVLHQEGKCYLWRARPLNKDISLGQFHLHREIHYQLPFGYGMRTLSILKI